MTPEGEYYNRSENFSEWKPGNKRDYSNVAFGLLGYIVEKVSDLPFNEYCNRNIFEPLEMKGTGWFLKEVDTLNHIIPYNFISNAGLIKEYPKDKLRALNDYCALCLYSFPNYTDGLVRTSVRELSSFLIAMINKGAYNNRRILKESTVKKMLSLQLDGNSSQGLCWSQKDFGNLWGHSGSDPGVETNLYFNPDSKIGIITFQNRRTSRNNSFDILKKLYLAAAK